MGIFSKISAGLKKTRDNITEKMDAVIHSFTSIDEDLLEELEETLILADVGAVTAARICGELRVRIKRTGVTDPARLRGMIRDIAAEMLAGDTSLKLDSSPAVILVIGVNGAGKTTSIGKMAAQLKEQGKTVILGAADTFRAAAVVFDTIQAGKARGRDIILIDTAGRLHNKKNLMDELSKISRVIDRELPDADKEVLLVLDATTGQNALNQARQFRESAGLTGIILTKLDGTAKGGVVIGIKEELGIPIKYVGVGEQIDDLRVFDPVEFASALFEGEGDNP
jgi:fused signal recognition particle receptor